MPKPKPVRLHPIPHATERELIDALIARGDLKVTRYPEMRRPREASTVGRKGGAIPSYLNPLYMGQTQAEIEEQRHA